VRALSGCRALRRGESRRRPSRRRRWGELCGRWSWAGASRAVSGRESSSRWRAAVLALAWAGRARGVGEGEIEEELLTTSSPSSLSTATLGRLVSTSDLLSRLYSSSCDPSSGSAGSPHLALLLVLSRPRPSRFVDKGRHKRVRACCLLLQGSQQLERIRRAGLEAHSVLSTFSRSLRSTSRPCALSSSSCESLELRCR